MNTALFYTIQPGDTLASIVLDINSAAGATVEVIVKHNKLSSTLHLPIGHVISIPYCSGCNQLRYQMKPGDTLKSLSLALFLCSGVTEQLILLENPGLTRKGLKTAMILAIPAVTQGVEYCADASAKGNTLFAVKH